MILISTSHYLATDLGYLLHKNPANIYDRPTTFGRVKVFFPVATPEIATAVLVAELDTVKLVLGRASSSSLAERYINDRPYTANSYLSVALADAYGTAMNGTCKHNQPLADQVIDDSELETVGTRMLRFSP
jgi:RNA repair, ligase-Pnkp-associating, region of Hen1